jgi:hypothetical protein
LNEYDISEIDSFGVDAVWRYPDFLIIILKRFVYLERGPGGVAGSVKLDNRVEFPLQDLDLNPYLSGLFRISMTLILTSTPTGAYQVCLESL